MAADGLATIWPDFSASCLAAATTARRFLGALGGLAHRGGDLVQGGGGFLQAGGLLFGAARQIVGGGRSRSSCCRTPPVATDDGLHRVAACFSAAALKLLFRQFGLGREFGGDAAGQVARARRSRPRSALADVDHRVAALDRGLLVGHGGAFASAGRRAGRRRPRRRIFSSAASLKVTHGGGHLADLVLAAGGRDVDAVVARGQAAHGGRHGGDRPGDGARQQQPAAQGDGDGDADADQQGQAWFPATPSSGRSASAATTLSESLTIASMAFSTGSTALSATPSCLTSSTACGRVAGSRPRASPGSMASAIVGVGGVDLGDPRQVGLVALGQLAQVLQGGQELRLVRLFQPLDVVFVAREQEAPQRVFLAGQAEGGGVGGPQRLVGALGALDRGGRNSI
jgi:hypothetical protein